MPLQIPFLNLILNFENINSIWLILIKDQWVPGLFLQLWDLILRSVCFITDIINIIFWWFDCYFVIYEIYASFMLFFNINNQGFVNKISFSFFILASQEYQNLKIITIYCDNYYFHTIKRCILVLSQKYYLLFLFHSF
jgi:hypothetical protein